MNTQNFIQIKKTLLLVFEKNEQRKEYYYEVNEDTLKLTPVIPIEGGTIQGTYYRKNRHIEDRVFWLN